MSIGVPVIGTPVGGIPDFLKDGETGLFCKADDPKDLAEKIKEAIGAKNADEKVKIAYEKVKNYTWQKKAENIVAFIKSKTNV